MAMAMELVACISTVVSLVHTAAETLRRCCSQMVERSDGALDRHMKLLEFELKSTDVKLAEWKDLWCPDDLGTEASFLLLWGQAGRREIQCQLQTLLLSAQTITDRLGQLDSALREPHTKENSRTNWFRRSLTFRSPQDGDETLRKQLKNSVVTLDRTVTDLVASADTHFRSIHATTKTESQDHCHLPKIFESRVELDAIYAECKRQNVRVDMDLNLLNNDQDIDKFPDIFDWRDLKLVYHFFVLGSQAELELRDLRLESATLSDNPNTTIDQTPSERISDPLNLSLPGSNLTFQCDLDSPQYCQQVTLRGQSAVRVLDTEDELITRQLLTVSLPTTTASNTRICSIEHRILLAYRIVESALFLLGTPWLSHLSYSTIVDRGNFEVDGQCGLHVNFQEPLRQHSDQWQVFTIGRLLVEIALDAPWQICGDEATTLPHELAEKVRANTNWSYLQACEQCFRIAADKAYETPSDASPTSEPPRKLLTAFYTDVFLR